MYECAHRTTHHAPRTMHHTMHHSPCTAPPTAHHAPHRTANLFYGALHVLHEGYGYTYYGYTCSAVPCMCCMKAS